MALAAFLVAPEDFWEAGAFTAAEDDLVAACICDSSTRPKTTNLAVFCSPIEFDTMKRPQPELISL